MKKLILKIGNKFKQNNLSLVTAESCSGGGLAYCLSREPEISSILERGYIVYSNPSKQDLLKVNPGTLQIHGAVSKAVAREMAQGALKNSQAQIAIAITGIAGPDITPKSDKQAGVVWICCLDFAGNENVNKKIIKGSRSQFIDGVIYESIKELDKILAKLTK